MGYHGIPIFRRNVMLTLLILPAGLCDSLRRRPATAHLVNFVAKCLYYRYIIISHNIPSMILKHFSMFKLLSSIHQEPSWKHKTTRRAKAVVVKHVSWAMKPYLLYFASGPFLNLAVTVGFEAASEADGNMTYYDILRHTMTYYDCSCGCGHPFFT